MGGKKRRWWERRHRRRISPIPVWCCVGLFLVFAIFYPTGLILLLTGAFIALFGLWFLNYWR